MERIPMTTTEEPVSAVSATESAPKLKSLTSGPGRPSTVSVEERIGMCEREIGEVLKRHGCRIVPAIRWDPVGRGNTLSKMQVEAVVSIVPDLPQ